MDLSKQYSQYEPVPIRSVAPRIELSPADDLTDALPPFPGGLRPQGGYGGRPPINMPPNDPRAVQGEDETSNAGGAVQLGDETSNAGGAVQLGDETSNAGAIPSNEPSYAEAENPAAQPIEEPSPASVENTSALPPKASSIAPAEESSDQFAEVYSGYPDGNASDQPPAESFIVPAEKSSEKPANPPPNVEAQAVDINDCKRNLITNECGSKYPGYPYDPYTWPYTPEEYKALYDSYWGSFPGSPPTAVGRKVALEQPGLGYPGTSSGSIYNSLILEPLGQRSGTSSGSIYNSLILEPLGQRSATRAGAAEGIILPSKIKIKQPGIGHRPLFRWNPTVRYLYGRRPSYGVDLPGMHPYNRRPPVGVDLSGGLSGDIDGVVVVNSPRIGNEGSISGAIGDSAMMTPPGQGSGKMSGAVGDSVMMTPPGQGSGGLSGDIDGVMVVNSPRIGNEGRMSGAVSGSVMMTPPGQGSAKYSSEDDDIVLIQAPVRHSGRIAHRPVFRRTPAGHYPYGHRPSFGIDLSGISPHSRQPRLGAYSPGRPRSLTRTILGDSSPRQAPPQSLADMITHILERTRPIPEELEITDSN